MASGPVADIMERLGKAASSSEVKTDMALMLEAEELISALHPPYDEGSPKASKVAECMESMVRAVLRKIEIEG